MEFYLFGNCIYDIVFGKIKRIVGKYCVVLFVIF